MTRRKRNKRRRNYDDLYISFENVCKTFDIQYINSEIERLSKIQVMLEGLAAIYIEDDKTELYIINSKLEILKAYKRINTELFTLNNLKNADELEIEVEVSLFG